MAHLWRMPDRKPGPLHPPCTSNYRSDYLRKGVIIVADSPLIKMAVAGANRIAAMTSGGDSQFEIATNMTQVLQKYEERRPPL